MYSKTSMDDSMLTKSMMGLPTSGSSNVIGVYNSSPKSSSIRYSGYLFKRSNKPFVENAAKNLVHIDDKISARLIDRRTLSSNNNEQIGGVINEPPKVVKGVYPQKGISTAVTGNMPSANDALDFDLILPELDGTVPSKPKLPLEKKIEHLPLKEDSRSPTDHALDLLSSFFGTHTKETTSKKDQPSPVPIDARASDVLPLKVSTKKTLPQKTPPKSILKVPSPRTKPIAITASGSSSNMSNSSHSQNHMEPETQMRIPLHELEMDATNTISCPSRPSDYTDPKDGHRWRAKYCILVDGVLYFYPDAKIGNSRAAEMERERMSISNSNGSDAASSSDGSLGSVGLDINDVDHLAKSPMVRSLHPMLSAKEKNGGGSFCHDPNVYWEKRVALNMVGAVRSSPAFGEKAFELIAMSSDKDSPTDEVDRLILRADAVHDVNCWIFEIHKSFVYLMKQLASYVGSKDNRYGLTNDVGKSYQLSKTSQWGVAVAKNSSRDLIAPASPAAMISSSFAPSGLLSSTFSHGHGMEFQKRSTRRPSLGHLDDGDENTKLTKFASPVSTPGGGSSPVYGMKIPRSNEGMFDNDSTISPPFFPRGKIPTTRSSVRLDIQDTSDENDVEDGSQIDSSQQMSSLSSMKETNILIPPTAGKYVPPHLRPKKYIPPHLRQKEAGKGIPSANIANEKKTAPSKSSLSNLLATQDTVNDIQDQVRSESKEFETEYLHSNGFGQDIGDGINIEDEKNSTSSSDSSQDGDEVIFKLGGCADPLLVVGSICDPMYKPISASKVGNTHAPAYHGFLSENSEIGAVSACGIRDKNEDAYVILSDLLHTDHLEDADTIDISDSYFSRFANHSLFAIFDGHCGNHAARYASEKFHSILLDESCSFNEEEGSEKKEEAVKKVDILKEILNNSIERLDAEFCDFCTDDGRGWYSGSTAIIGLMVDDDIAVASVGDASGVLSASAKNIDSAILTGWSVLEEHEEDLNKIGGSKGGIIFKEVAESHCPSRPAERERIQAANGWVTHETDIPIISQFQRMNWSDEDVLDIFHRCFSDRFSDSHGKPSRILDIYRVCGDLAVSRAIGDREYKAAFNKSETQTNEVNEWKSPAPIPFETYNDIHGEEHPGIFEGDLVIATPSIQFFQVGSYEDEFIVIACDGLWDVIDPDDAVRVTRNLIFVLGFSAKECAERLAELAGGLGSSDNITVIVVRFFGKSTDSTFETTNS